MKNGQQMVWLNLKIISLKSSHILHFNKQQLANKCGQTHTLLLDLKSDSQTLGLLNKARIKDSVAMSWLFWLNLAVNRFAQWRFILWSEPAPDQAKFWDLFNFFPYLSQWPPQVEANSFFYWPLHIVITFNKTKTIIWIFGQ